MNHSAGHRGANARRARQSVCCAVLGLLMPLLALARPTQPTIVCTGLPWGGGDRGKVQIYTVDMEGRALRQLTKFPGGAWNPRWSPDGSRIVFNASGRLSFMDPDGGSVEHLLLPVSNPDWSPDGTRIAFTVSGVRADIFVLDVATGEYRQLTKNERSNDHATWSPDGASLVFSSNRDPKFWAAPNRLTGDLYIMDADGRNARNITQTLEGEHSPAWSPDGRHIAFLLSPDGFSLHLYTLDLDTGRKRRLVSDRRITAASWHPNGEEILFSAYDPSSETGDIWIIRRDGTNLRQITRNRRGVVTYHAHLFDPGLAVSPMGKKATTWGGMKGRVQRRDRAGRTGSR